MEIGKDIERTIHERVSKCKKNWQECAAMKLKSFLIVLATICLTPPVSVSAGLIEDYVLLDRSYVPALALTNQRDKPLPIVEESMRRLATAWNKFVQGTTKEWGKTAMKEAITRSTVKVEEALGLVAVNKRKEAHEALETLRMVFWKARTDMGIKYLPDRFTAFHEPMEEFTDLAVKPDSDASKLREKLHELSIFWKEVEEAGLDVKLFAVSPERAAKYTDQVKREREILTQLESLIGSSNQEALAKAAGALKINFSQTYFVFGDFSGLQ
jgi:hypothetical protein